MPDINSRDTMIEYAKRRLGYPVIAINVSEDQYEDRLDDCIAYYRNFNSDAYEKVYLKHQMTSTDITNQYLPMDPLVMSVTRVLPFGGIFSTASGNIFNFKLQYAISDLVNFGSNESLISYSMTRQHLDLIDFLFNSNPQIRFNRHAMKLYFDIDWTQVHVGQYMVIECYRVLDPATYPDVFNDIWLKDYFTALVKKQWGSNLKKFGGLQLPGGTVFNGKDLYDEAEEEIKELRKELMDTYQEPVDFFTC